MEETYTLSHTGAQVDAETYTLSHTGAQVDAAIDAANAAAPQATTYTKQEVNNLIPEVSVLTTSDIDTIMS